MTIHIRAHFDGRVLIPDQPVELPINQPLDIEVSRIGSNGAMNGESLPGPDMIAEGLRKLDSLNNLLPGPVIPLDALQRENMYDDRA